MATKEKKVQDVRMDALKKIVSAGNKLFGDGAMFRGGDNAALDIESISTGSLGLDNAIGVGGLPKGRIIEIFGKEASGKTMMALATIAQCQKNGGIAAFIDAEHALTPDWVKSLGVDYDNLLVTQPDSGERALRLMEFFVNQRVDIVVLDSVAALVTKREIEGDMGDQHMAQTARLMSLALKKLTPTVAKSETCCIFINQIRDNVGVMYGEKEVTPGGKALKFYSSVRLKTWKSAQGAIKIGSGINEEQIGHNVSIKVVKNKVAAPFKMAKFDLYYASGIDTVSEIANLAIEKEVVERPNSRTYIVGDAKFTSRGDFDTAIKNDKKLQDTLIAGIKESMSKREVIAPSTPAPEGEVAEEVPVDAADLETVEADLK